MKKVVFVLFLAVILQSSYALPFNYQQDKGSGLIMPYLSQHEVFLRSQMETRGVRSVSYSILGIKGSAGQPLVIEFRCSGDFSITILQNDDNCVHTQYVSVAPNRKLTRISIPVSSFSKGAYTMIITNLNSGETASGAFTI